MNRAGENSNAGAAGNATIGLGFSIPSVPKPSPVKPDVDEVSNLSHEIEEATQAEVLWGDDEKNLQLVSCPP